MGPLPLVPRLQARRISSLLLDWWPEIGATEASSRKSRGWTADRACSKIFRPMGCCAFIAIHGCLFNEEVSLLKQFFRIRDLSQVEMLPGIHRRAVWTDGAMLTFFSFAPGSVVPEHEHPHEQITVVTRGALEFMLDGEIHVLRAGDGVRIGSNLRHSARALDEATEAFDAWNPPREDYRIAE